MIFLTPLRYFFTKAVAFCKMAGTKNAITRKRLRLFQTAKKGSAAVEEKQKKRRTENIANRRLFRRTIILMVIFGVLAFIPVVGKLWNLQITRHDELEEMAVDQQTSTLAVTAARGTIYDRNGNVLAISSTAYDVIISPRAIIQKQAELDQKKEEAIKADKDYTDYDKDVEDLVVTGMASILDLDENDLREKCRDTNSQYKRLAIKVDADVEDAIRAYMEEHDLTGCIYLQPNTKRYYPYSTLASQIIGFTNDSGGAYGLEAKFDDDLAGTNGLVVTAQNASGTDLLNFFQDYYDAEDGSDLHLTLDTNIQTMCESILAKGIEANEALEGGFIIAMDCNSGAVLGMASSPDYDLNNYSTVIDSQLLEDIEAKAQSYIEEGMDEETARSSAYSEALYTQWSNKAINDTYEPGSTFKPLVLAAALEEGVTNPGDTFNCTGSLQVADREISCSKTSGHGLQDLATAVGNSCNPAFMMIGQRLGAETFYKYMEAFGIITTGGGSTSTGIDLPGEGASIFWDYDSFGIVNLATASFGQRFQVTPIQMVAAVNTVINGGYYYQPHVVDYIEDAQGNITYSADTPPLRQVISAATSQTCREMLEGVVANNLTGKNAYRAGYRIGGKTGTSETLQTDTTHRYIVSFMGFAPADDPQVIVLVAFDHPDYPMGATDMTTSGGQYISGGNMAAPYAGDLLVEILDYLNYGKQYTSDEISGADTMVPYFTGNTVSYARSVCEEFGFTCRVVGEGDDSSIVQYQTPAPTSYIPAGNEILVYIGDAVPPETVTMPDLTGMTPDQVIDELNAIGIYMKATGASGYYTSETRVYDQSVAAGEGIAPGSVITVYFNDTSDRDNETGVIG